MAKNLLIVAAVFLLAAGLIAAEEMLKLVEASGEARLSDDSTPAEAKAIALNNARRRALEEAVGIVVSSRSDVYNFQVISDFVTAATKGLIVREKVLENKCAMREEQIMCVARIEATVKPLNLARKGNLKIVNASVQRPDRDAPSRMPVFQNGDEIQVSATISEDGYMNLFGVDQYGAIVKIFPNDYAGRKKVSPKMRFVFPTNEERLSGLKIRVSSPKRLRKGIESVLIIVTKDKINLLADPMLENPTVSDLMRELSEIDQSSWADRTVGYEVKE